MTPEQRLEKLEQQMLGQQAVALTLTAEMNSLLAMLRQIVSNPASIASPDDMDAAFLEGRQSRLRLLLLLQEKTNPALAARLSEMLDQPGLNFPVDWD